jgi:hypothetical protein
MRKHEYYHRQHSFRLNVYDRILIAIVIAFFLAILMGIDTATTWEDQAADIAIKQSSMQVQLDQMQAEQVEMRHAVDAWTGVTEPMEAKP